MAETFGIILAEARMKKGLSLEQVSAVLRIRPAILASLEREDYFGMPLKGHSRNMVSAYSRFLGLDSAAVTELFLQNYRDFEHAEAQRRRETAGLPLDPRTAKPPVLGSSPPPMREPASAPGQGVRSIWDKPTPSSELRTGYDSRSARSQRLAKNAAKRRTTLGTGSGTTGGVSDSRSNRRGRNASRNPSRGDSRIGSFDQNRQAGRSSQNQSGGFIRQLMTTTPLPLIMLVVALVGMLVFWAVAANSCNRQPEEYIPLQSVDPQDAGDNDLTDDPLLNPNASPEPRADQDYGPFDLTIVPAPGTEPWVTIVVDGEKKHEWYLSETVTYKVMINCEIVAGNPGSTTILRNGVEQEMDVGIHGIGNIKMEIIERPINEDTTNNPVDDQ
ncbi:MAG: helix-turn-helix domain-containing protein [Coriobacteriia bacterium]|nr:helix-turn-helix domain-containing protein [Coriobacteriia bacterium]